MVILNYSHCVFIYAFSRPPLPPSVTFSLAVASRVSLLHAASLRPSFRPYPLPPWEIPARLPAFPSRSASIPLLRPLPPLRAATAPQPRTRSALRASASARAHPLPPHPCPQPLPCRLHAWRLQGVPARLSVPAPCRLWALPRLRLAGHPLAPPHKTPSTQGNNPANPRPHRPQTAPPLPASRTPRPARAPRAVPFLRRSEPLSFFPLPSPAAKLLSHTYKAVRASPAVFDRVR